MGCYLNPGSEGLQRSLRSQIYVDKSLLIRETNRLVRTERRYVCVSRPRQFGKTMALDMLAVYYGSGADTRSLFEGLEIGVDASFYEHLNRYDVLRVNMQQLVGHDLPHRLNRLNAHIVDELVEANRTVRFKNKKSLPQVLMDIFAATGRFFVILIDEWDCPLRENGFDPGARKLYLEYLLTWLKDQDYVALAYMTGSLPVACYEAGAALNMFVEDSMIHPGGFAGHFGFTLDEAKALCEARGKDIGEMQKWYGGYLFFEPVGKVCEILHPRSVVEALERHWICAYWTRADEFTACVNALRMKSDGVRESIVRLLSGEVLSIEGCVCWQNSDHMRTRDELLVLLVHLGCLAYNAVSGTVSVPNREALEMLDRVVRYRDVDLVFHPVEPFDPFSDLL